MIKLVKLNGYLFVTLADGNVISGRIENFEFQQENATNKFDLIFKGQIIADSELFSNFENESEVAFASASDLIEFYTTLQNPLAVIEQTSNGVFGYVTGDSGSVVLNSGEKIKSISAYSEIGGSVTIGDGDPIIIPANGSVDVPCDYNLVDPTVIFTATTTYLITFIS
jgi:hypothetical protein